MYGRLLAHIQGRLCTQLYIGLAWTPMNQQCDFLIAAHSPFFVVVYHPGEHGSEVGARAYQQQDDYQHALEVEDCRLGRRKGSGHLNECSQRHQRHALLNFKHMCA